MITVKLRHLRISARKVRLVTNLIKGLDVAEAQIRLKFLVKKSSEPVLKLLNSAVAGALKNQNVAKENLYVANILVDSGPSLKRWRARAMGRAAGILKRTCHITLILEEKDPSLAKAAPMPDSKEKEAAVLPKPKKTPQSMDKVEIKDQPAPKEKMPPKRPYHQDTQSKKRFFSRQTFGNVKKTFRRKSI